MLEKADISERIAIEEISLPNINNFRFSNIELQAF
jgi:hypothetical protein